MSHESEKLIDQIMEEIEKTRTGYMFYFEVEPEIAILMSNDFLVKYRNAIYKPENMYSYGAISDGSICGFPIFIDDRLSSSENNLGFRVVTLN